jgi:hypothetical protein
MCLAIMGHPALASRAASSPAHHTRHDRLQLVLSGDDLRQKACDAQPQSMWIVELSDLRIVSQPQLEEPAQTTLVAVDPRQHRDFLMVQNAVDRITQRRVAKKRGSPAAAA